MRLPSRSAFARDVLKLVGGTTTAQAIGLLIVPLLARLYPPEAFGILSVFNSIVAILVVVSCLRYEFAIQLPKEEQEASNLLILCFALTSVISMAIAGCVALYGGEIAVVLNVPDLAMVMWMIPIAVLTGGLLLALSQWNSRKRKYGSVAIAQVSKVGVTSILQLGLGVLGNRVSRDLVGGVVIGGVVASIGLVGQVWITDYRVILGNFDVRIVRSVLGKYRKFPLFDIWGALLNSISWQLPILMLAFFFSSTVVGNYGMASRLVYFPISLIGASVGQVFYQRASQLHARQEPLIGLVSSVLERLIAVLIYPALLMVLIGKSAMLILLGSGWADAGSYIQILGAWSFFWFVSSPLSTLFLVMEKQESLLVIQVVILVTRVLSLAVGGIMKNVQLALVLFSVSGMLIYGVLLSWICVLAGLRVSRLGQLLWDYFLLSIPGVAVVVCAQALMSSHTFLVLAVGAISAIFYYYIIFRRRRYLFKI